MLSPNGLLEDENKREGSGIDVKPGTCELVHDVLVVFKVGVSL